MTLQRDHLNRAPELCVGYRAASCDEGAIKLAVVEIYA